MSENKKNTPGSELDLEEMEKVAGGIYMRDKGACPNCKTLTNGEWSDELKMFICPNCHFRFGNRCGGIHVQGVI